MRSYALALELVAAAIAGALVATMAGYAVEMLGTSRNLEFELWLSRPELLGWWPWPILGGVAGVLRVLSRNLRRS